MHELDFDSLINCRYDSNRKFKLNYYLKTALYRSSSQYNTK